MYPVYGGMTAYPYQRNQAPSATYYHPSWEAVPPRTNEEHPSSVCTHESWPHYGYHAPMQCHNCYTHVQRPSYYDFRPPCSHFPHMQPPPPPAYNHFCGGYPHHQPPYPMYCPPPPPHYSVELPRYDYDKSAPRDQFHCCGCPNRTCQSERRNGVKIEEQEPEVETKKSEPLFPAGANNFSYPIVWYPPDFTSNKEQPRRLVNNESVDQQGLPSEKPQMPRRSIESEVRDNEGSSVYKKPQWSPENADPNFGYRWFPWDLNSIKRLTKGEQEKNSEDEKATRPVGNKDQNEQMSFPIIWVPYDKLLKNHPEDQVENKKAAEESPASYSVSPRKIDHVDKEEEKGKIAPRDCDGKSSNLGIEKKNNVRTIPVKQLDESTPKLPNKEEECKPSSSTKKPKLPPICLRVDPPKKKNGSSRSPSPPGDKNRQDSDVSRLEVKNKQPQEIKVKGTQDETPQESKIEVSSNTGEASGLENKVQHDNNKSAVIPCGDDKVPAQESQASEVGGGEKKEVQFDNIKSGEAKCVDDEVQAQESKAVKENEAEPERMHKRKIMSETEAAIIIQSAYRGYDLRRWEPLKKLRVMEKVREETVQVKKNIEDLEAHDVLDGKTKTFIGEKIMKLLLQLDTLQGLHESIRDVRRSLAKELTSLQEKLDSIIDRKQDTSNLQAAEHTPQNTVAIEESKGISESAEDLSKDSSLDGVTNAAVSERNHDNSFVQQPLPSEGDVCVSTNLVTEESLPMQSPKETQDELSMGSDVGVVEDMNIESHSVSKNKDQEATTNSELPQEVIETSAAMEPAEDVTQGNGLLSSNHNQEVNHLLDSPEVDNEQSLANTNNFQDTTHEDNNEAVVRTEDQEVDLLSELPREAVDEDKNVTLHSEVVMEPQVVIEGQEANIASEVPREVVDEDEKVVPHSELVMEPQERVEGQEAHIISEVSREVVDEDEKGMPCPETVVESSDKIQDHEADMLSEMPVEVIEESTGDNEDTSVINHEDNPPEVSAGETQIGLEAGTVDNAANFDFPIVQKEGNKLQESTGERESEEPENEVDDMNERKETSNVEISFGETTSLNGPQSENDDKSGVFDNIQENESETPPRKISEVQCSFDASSLAYPIGENEHVPELLTDAHVHESETKSEADMQQSKAVEKMSITADENEVQAEKKIKEENEKLRKLLETLLESGKEQQEVISSLSGKVKDLEKKLAKKKTRSTRHPRIKVARSYCGKPANVSVKERPMGTAS